mmetsp:Transcript_72181/g.105782  ORF Transcript_72181/g.105782 Transcript_72181/m.105782 type:complete len:88 (+) Transcript_72181:902-1165(+)
MCTCAVCVGKGTKYTERSVAHGDSTAEEISHAELSSIKHWRTDVSNPVLPHAGELTGQIDGDVWQCSHMRITSLTPEDGPQHHQQLH